MSRSGSAIEWSSSIRVCVSTRGTTTVFDCGERRVHERQRAPLAAKGERQQHGARRSEFRQRGDLRRDGGGRSGPCFGRLRVAPLEDLPAQRELRLVQRDALRCDRVAAGGGAEACSEW